MIFTNENGDKNETSTGVFSSIDDAPLLTNSEDEKLWQAEHRAFQQIANEKSKLTELDSL